MARWIEFPGGMLLSRGFPTSSDPNVTGETLQCLEALLDSYFKSVQQTPLFRARSEADRVLASVRNYAFWVRGDAYLHQYREMAQSLYKPHGPWFRSHLGFTIDEAIAVVDALSDDYGRRIRHRELLPLGG